MTLGELVALLEDVKVAQHYVKQAELSLHHGGNEETMKGKRLVLEYSKQHLDQLLATEIFDEGL